MLILILCCFFLLFDLIFIHLTTQSCQLICYGSNSCNRATITGITGILRGVGNQAFTNATIVSGIDPNADDTTVRIEINGNIQGVCNIYCDQDNTCRVDCQTDDACTSLYLHCFGTCYLRCDKSGGINCPLVEGPHIDWTYDITESPTEYPSEFPFVNTTAPVFTSLNSTLVSTSGSGDRNGGDGSSGNGREGMSEVLMVVVICISVIIIILIVSIVGCIYLSHKRKIKKINAANIQLSTSGVKNAHMHIMRSNSAYSAHSTGPSSIRTSVADTGDKHKHKHKHFEKVSIELEQMKHLVMHVDYQLLL